jgi:hypothetical protein
MLSLVSGLASACQLDAGVSNLLGIQHEHAQGEV